MKTLVRLTLEPFWSSVWPRASRRLSRSGKSHDCVQMQSDDAPHHRCHCAFCPCDLRLVTCMLFCPAIRHDPKPFGPDDSECHVRLANTTLYLAEGLKGPKDYCLPRRYAIMCMPRHAIISCYNTVPCCAMPCHAVPCCAMLCCAMGWLHAVQ